MTPKRRVIHPVQEITAVVEAVKNGIMSRKRAVAQLGEDVEDIDAENAIDMARAMLLKLGYPVYSLDKVPPDPNAMGAPAADGEEPGKASFAMSLLSDAEDLDGDDFDFDDRDEDEVVRDGEELEPV